MKKSDLKNYVKEILGKKPDDICVDCEDQISEIDINPELQKIAGEIFDKLPKEGSYELGELFDDLSKEYNLSDEDSKEVYVMVKDLEDKDLNEEYNFDINDDIFVKLRAQKDQKPEIPSKPEHKKPDNTTKLNVLNKERERLMANMEQEAEPEGGPIADEYGTKLDRIDKAIAKLNSFKDDNTEYSSEEMNNKINQTFLREEVVNKVANKFKPTK